MKTISCLAIVCALSLLSAGCGGGGYKYEPPPENSGVSEQVEKDAGVVTDEALMSSGAENK